MPMNSYNQVKSLQPLSNDVIQNHRAYGWVQCHTTTLSRIVLND